MNVPGTDLEMFIDGACKGNPGPASVGIVIYQDKNKIKEVSKEIGSATNNIAEYTALVYALQEALVLKANRLKIFTDSELLFKQVTGAFEVKNEKLLVLFDQVRRLMEGFEQVELKHVPREQNKEADHLASQVFKKSKQVKVVASSSNEGGEESPSSEG